LALFFGIINQLNNEYHFIILFGQFTAID